MISSVNPPLKYSSDESSLRFTKGRTATVGCSRAGGREERTQVTIARATTARVATHRPVARGRVSPPGDTAVSAEPARGAKVGT